MTIPVRLPVQLVALAASAGAIAWAVSARRAELACLAAGLFVVLLIVAGLQANRTLWRLPPGHVTPATAPTAGIENATLIALGYGWGAATLSAVYTLSGLVWQHGLQYAAGMAVIAVGLALYARALSAPDGALRAPVAQRGMLQLTLLHTALAAAGLAFLFLSGKLKSGKDDWAANIVFLMGGIAILALSAMAAFTQARLSRRD